jgi:hypothetical protein
VSVLLRQPHAFEGLRAAEVVSLPDRQALAQGEQLKEVLADGHAASRSMPAQLGRYEDAVPKVEEFLRVEPNIPERIEQYLPNLTDAVMAVICRVRVGEQLGRLILGTSNCSSLATIPPYL